MAGTTPEEVRRASSDRQGSGVGTVREPPLRVPAHAPGTGSPDAAGTGAGTGRFTPPTTLGAFYWFDVPTMLAMLAMGAFATGSAISGIILLGFYASGVALNLLDTLVMMRPRASNQDALAHWQGKGLLGAVLNFLPRWKGRGLPVVFNFLLDTAFIAGVIVLNPLDDSALTLIMLVVAGVRFMAHVTGTRSPATLLFLALPAMFVLLQDSYKPVWHVGGSPASEVLIMTCLLFAAYAIISNTNRRMAEEATLAEQDARRLADQVLLLYLLQDSIRAMNSAIELDELLQMVVNNAVRVLDVEQSSIGLIDPQTGELVIQCATGVDSSELHRRRFVPGIGVAGWVVQNGKPLIVADVRRDIRYVDPYTEGIIGRTTRSMLCVPLVVERKVIGTLCVTHSQPRALTEDHQSLLTSFAEQAALAVHKSQLLEERTRQGEELRRRGELISTLNSIAQSVLSSLERKQVLETIISRISELSSFDQGAIYLTNERTGKLELQIESPKSKVQSPKSFPLTLETDRWASDLEQSPKSRVFGPPTLDFGLWTLDSDSVLCLPLVNQGRPLGCILLARGGANPFNEVEVDTAEKLADAATIAIVNAGLFSKVSDQQQQAAALYRLMLKVNAAPNRRQLAHVLVQELQQVTGAKAAALLINETEQARISLWATTGEWAGHDASGVSLAGHSDPFVVKALTTIHQQETPGLLLIHDAPDQVKSAFGGNNCVTIPLVQSGRIYGLLVIEPGTDPPILEDLRETVSLAVSHSTVALERAELFEQTLQSAHQSSMLYSIAAEVQTSLDQATVVQMTVNGALEALPIQSCELYLFDDDKQKLQRRGMAIAPSVKKSSLPLGPNTVALQANSTQASSQSPLTQHFGLSTLDSVVQSPKSVGARHASPVQSPPDPDFGLWTLDFGPERGDQDTGPARVVLGRLIGSEEPLGILRLTTTLPGDEFVRQHATFCQTLLSHSAGALERSRLYTTTANQASMLQQRAQQLTDILNLGILSAADVPLPTLMPRIAAGVARSLGFSYVRIGEIGPDSGDTEVWAFESQTLSGVQGSSSHALSLSDLELLMERGQPAGRVENGAVMGYYLDEALLAEIVPGQPTPPPGATPKPLILMPLESTSGGTLGYMLAGVRGEGLGVRGDEGPGISDAAGRQALTPNPSPLTPDEHDLLELLSIYALRISLIIENHRVYSQLLDSKRKIEAVVLSISDGVVVTDADLNVLISNSLADQIMGMPPGGSQGYPLKWLIANEDLINLLRECIAASKSNSMDLDLRLGREARTYQAFAHPIVAPELGVVGAVITLRDVTVERATERAKSDFLSIVSHELRTPLNSVMGFLDIILMNKTGPLTELQADFLTTAKQEAQVLQRLINDLLDTSQLQSGLLRLEMAPVNLSSVLARVVNQAVPRMVEDQLVVVANVPDNVIVVGDEIRLEQVFKNLLDNAAKFTDAGGEIRFECDLENDTVTISVTDTGCGIPPAQVGEVFERFYQAENNSHKFKRGLGLGLAICKQIVEAHGGRIWLESELGVGTSVHVELLLFSPDSELYEFDTQSGTAILAPARSADG